MKKLFLSLIIGLCSSMAWAHEGYIEGQTGIIGSNGSIAPIYGVRGGILLRAYDPMHGWMPTKNSWDISAGYWSARGIKNDDLVSGGLDLHVLSFEAYRIFNIGKTWTAKAGGGIGFTIPNLDGGASETADNGHSWVFGGGADYDLTPNISVGASVKGFFFTTNTHVTTYSSHTETLNTGQDVEVLDINHHDNVVCLNSVLALLSLNWK